MGDHDLLERLVVAVESIAKNLEIKAVIVDHRGNIMKDVNEMDPKFFEAAERVINTTRETKENETVIQEITEVKESTTYIDVYPINTIKHESDNAYFIKNPHGLIKCIPKQYIEDKILNPKNPDIIERIILTNVGKWVLKKPWKEDEYQ